MRVRHPRLALAAVLLVPLQGCGGPPEETRTAWAGAVDTAAGVVRVRNPDRPVCPVVAETVPDLSIGVTHGDPDYELVRVWDVEAGEDGTIYVADAGRKQIMVYDSAGRFVRAIGREGDGPGEFRHLAQLGWNEGRLTALDRVSSRLSYFTAGGELLGDTTLRDLPGLARVGWLAPGHLIAQLGPLWNSPPIPGFHGVGRLVRVPRGGGREPPLLLEWSDTAASVHVAEPGLSLVAQVPFGVQAAWATDPRESILYFSEGSEYRILAYDTSGALRREITRTHRPVQVDAGERDSVLQSLAHYDPRVRQRLRIPATKPPVRGLQVDDRGRVWVRTATEVEGAGQRWEVFDREGIFRFAVRLPSALQLIRVREPFLLGTSRDSLGVVSVERHRFEPPC